MSTGTEAWLRAMFQSWLTELSPDQRAALAGNWENVMNDAALDRVDSWVIAGNALTALRASQPGVPEQENES